MASTTNVTWGSPHPEEPGFDVIVKVIRTGNQQVLYFRRVVPQRSTDDCRWQQINNNEYYAGTFSLVRYTWHAVQEMGSCYLYREEKKVNEKDLEKGDIVDVRAEVVIGDVPDKVLVRLSSNYNGPVERWFNKDQVTLVTRAINADEPPAGALVEVETVTGVKFYYLRDLEDGSPKRWRRQGDNYSAIAWHSVKGSGRKWQRLYRDGEI